MIQINLLPVREIKRRNKYKKQIALSLVLFFSFLAALGLFAYLQADKIVKLDQNLKKLQQDKQQYTKILNDIKKLEEDRKILETRIAVIKQLKDSSAVTVHVLDEVAKLTPADRMWLTGLSQTGSALKISGMALDNQTVAKYMDDLEGSQYIQSVALATSTMKQFAERNLKQFSLSSTVHAPSVEKKTESPTK